MTLAIGTGKHFGVRSAEIFEQRNVEAVGRGFGIGERDGENGVGAELGFGFGAVEFEHDAINGQLIESIDALAGRAGFCS